MKLTFNRNVCAISDRGVARSHEIGQPLDAKLNP